VTTALAAFIKKRVPALPRWAKEFRPTMWDSGNFLLKIRACGARIPPHQELFTVGVGLELAEFPSPEGETD